MRNLVVVFCVFVLSPNNTWAANNDAVQTELTKTNIEAKSFAKKEPVFIEAANIDYDSKNKIVTASGKVEILKGETVLFADNVKYDQIQNLVYASGNVVVTGKDGNTIFSDNFVLKGDFKEGVIKFFRARLSDGSLLAAASAQRIDGDKVILQKAVYSPCKICVGSNADPLWQLKADKVIMDDTAQNVTYDEASMEIYGTPVIYTPYFRHPTPNADAKSGFLSPSVNTDGNLGVAVKTPYYWRLADNMDATFEPITTSKEGLVAAGGFKNLLTYGNYNIYGSITRPRGFTELADTKNGSDAKSVRGHLKGEGIFDLTKDWKTGFKADYASDDTYLRRYKYGNEDLLTSRAYVERISDRNYTNLQTVHFQGLLEQDNSDTIPLVLPYTRNHYESEKGIIPGFGGSYAYGDLRGFSVNRNLGDKSHRISAAGGIKAPIITSGGHIFEADLSLRGDAFNIDQSVSDTLNKQRLIPEVSFGWRLPLVSKAAGGSFYLEPIAKYIASPNKNYNKNIPNEDSQDVEYSDLNVFSNNRFRGIDRVESGNRLQYGLNAGYYEEGVSVSGLLGQSYNFSKTNALPTNTGLEDNRSDYVGRISTKFYNTLDLAYRFRIDNNMKKIRRNEIDGNLDLSPVHIQANYIYLDYDYTNSIDNREEISGETQFDLDENWKMIAGGRRNLATNTNIDASVGLGYENECVNTLVLVKRTFLSDRDAKGGTSFNFQVGLKNLGTI